MLWAPGSEEVSEGIDRKNAENNQILNLPLTLGCVGHDDSVGKRRAPNASDKTRLIRASPHLFRFRNVLPSTALAVTLYPFVL
jgi:hypothetical protein